ncbi:MAG TPA: Ig-like domain-containing protein [Gemmatimonadaceae bacterium]|jgi:VCBS repeat-containing protein|nr:Ig-like domain-containing protein [Gemmatimonadaceae bacterium]
MRNHLAAAALAAGLALPVFARPLHGQKALVYCPVGVDATGCDRIVSALQPKFAGGVDRGYDGSNGTLDLKSIDLDHYSVFVVPSLADDGDKQPYAALRAVAARLHLAINGRVAVYSGAPDQGNLNRADKDALIQNLATWAAEGHTRGTSLVGMVALLDLSTNPADRYSWVRSVSLADVSADAELQSFGDVTPISSRNGDVLPSGSTHRFANMASYGLHVGGRAAARTDVGAIGGLTAAGGQGVLVLYSNADRRNSGGASLDLSAGGAASGPTLTTDRPDYLPGDTVLFSGAAWAPSDTVTITVHEDPQWSNPDRTVVAVVDANGNLRSHDFVVQPRDFGVTFTATAVGNPSGLVAQVTFTDGTIATVINTAVLNTSSAAGQCGTTTPATFLVNHEYCGQTTVQDITGTGGTTLFMRWVRPGGGFGSIACSTSVPVLAGNTYGAKCIPDFPSTSTADWTFQVSAQSTFNPVLASVSVHVVSNTAPVANNDSYGTLEDAGLTVAAPGILGNDTDAENNPLTAVLVSGPAHGTLTLSANGAFTYTPVANYSGADSFTYKANDGTANSGAAATVNITVNAVNDAPSFTKGSDQAVLEDAGAQSISNWATAISAGPADEAGQTLTFVVTGNSNPGLFSAAPVVNANGALTYTPAANANGSATITLKLTDNGGTANGGVDASGEQTFAINVTAVNDAPSFTKGSDQTVFENAAAQTVSSWATAISAGPSDESGQTLTFVVSNGNNALFSAQPSIDATGKLTFTPAPDAFGTATVTVQLHDNGGTANGGVDASAAQTFTITITPINHAPSFTKGANQVVLEDAGAQSVNGWATGISAGPPNESAQALDFVVTNDNNALFSSQPAVDATGKLTYAPAANANGSATVTIKLHDNGGTVNGGVDTSPVQTFTIAVTPVNDAPMFTLVASNTSAEDAGAQTVNGALTNASAGPNEGGQKLTLTVTNNNNSLFTVQPSIDLATGRLTYTSAPNANGTATVTVKLQDDGGTANGGVDQTTKTFVITVTPVDDAPVITSFYGPVQPIALGASISVTGAFSDVDLGDTPPDSHVGTIDWGDGTTSSLSIAAGSGVSRSFSGSHTYAVAGVYTITAHIRDAGGLAGDATCKYPVVVFDSNGGFVTGGGWINTPTGKAAFGLVSKYTKGQATPGGDTEFQGPGFNFKSTSCDWLVTSGGGAKAMYQGSGTINGTGNYGFMVTVIDGSLAAKHSDMLRIRIWDKSSGAVVYDNQPGAADAADPTNATGGGSIRIHNN